MRIPAARLRGRTFRWLCVVFAAALFAAALIAVVALRREAEEIEAAPS